MPIENPMQLGMVAKVILSERDHDMKITALAYDGQGADGWVYLDLAKLPRHSVGKPFFYREVDAFVRLAHEIARRNGLDVVNEVDDYTSRELCALVETVLQILQPNPVGVATEA